MKFKIEWLRKWCLLPTSIQELEQQFTQLGFEVESIKDGDVIELSITPNRGDCLGILGLARELASLNKVPITFPDISSTEVIHSDVIQINNQAAKHCPKYLGRIIHNVNNKVVTPDWMQQTLNIAGIKTISPIVDITNYVLLEFGQPMHAFDINKIDGELIIRHAKDGEKLLCLDNIERELGTTDLLIADKSKPLALAGVIGGVESSINENTHDILFECANFAAIGIRLTARKHQIITDSSYRFERGVDINLAELAMNRATKLLQEICGGDPGHVITVVEQIQQADPICLRKDRIKKILGIYPADEEIVDILTRLGMSCVDCKKCNTQGWQVKIPSYRRDVSKEIDLIEEIARFIGYHKIPELMPHAKLQLQERSECQISELQVKNCFMNLGYNEVITYSFISLDRAKLFAPNMEKYLNLLNPMSVELSVMRPNLWPGLLQVFQYNANRKCNRLKIFESGLKFVFKDGQLQQEKVIAGLCVGKLYNEHWNIKNKDHDFFDIKADLEALVKLANLGKLEYKPSNEPALHPGKSAIVFKDGKQLGVFGELHPELLKSLDIAVPLLVFEFNLDILTTGNISKFCCISKFPGIRRDLAIIVSEDVIASDLVDAVLASGGKLLQDCHIFDLYCGKGIEPGKKSIALGLVLQHQERTLVDDEINQIIEKIIQELKVKFNAILR